MVDVGFDSDKHAQTRDDMKRGGESLKDSSEALGRLIDAQDPSYWSDEGGFQAMRTAIISLMKMEAQLIGSQKKSFTKFDDQVEQAAEAFEAAETANADQLAAILAGLDPSPTSGGGSTAYSTYTAAPTPVDNAAPPANAGTDAGASSSEPAQNAPSAI
ncbi:MAG: hypothetical protein E6340_06450 [Actinomyces sp.]|nr:hypothetical protein [Actinomyces sp.]